MAPPRTTTLSPRCGASTEPKPLADEGDVALVLDLSYGSDQDTQAFLADL